MNPRTWKAVLLFASIHLLIGWVAKNRHPVKEDHRKLEVKYLLDQIPAFSKSEVTE